MNSALAKGVFQHQQGGAGNGRDGEQKRETCSGFMADAGQNAHRNGGSGAGNPWHDSESLDQSDNQGVFNGNFFYRASGVSAGMASRPGSEKEPAGQEQHGAGN